MEEIQSMSLFEINNRLKLGVKEILPDSYWVIAEISEMNINQSGHCYLELIEKNIGNEQIIARAKATIWAFTFRMLRPYFESVTKQKLSTGLKIMIQVSAEFHEVYGYSLNVKDIEPSYTIGDLSRKKEEIIERLTSEGVFHLNKELQLPMVAQRIAVISSETAAGYGDFVDQLKNNSHGYSFYVKLYQAYMQGNEAEQSIIQALETIFDAVNQFDAVVIIRGGGSQADLNCFNSYWLCYHITQFPLPIITGIGHERDESIADLVAHTSLKTPTAVAEFLVEQVSSFDNYLQDLTNKVISFAEEQLADSKLKTERLSRSIVSSVKMRMNSEHQWVSSLGMIGRRTLKSYLHSNLIQLNTLKIRVKNGSIHYIDRKGEYTETLHKNLVLLVRKPLKDEKKRLDHYDNHAKLLDPALVLKRGYTITFRKGILIKTASQLKPGDEIESIWSDGKSTSIVNTINQTNDHT